MIEVPKWWLALLVISFYALVVFFLFRDVEPAVPPTPDPIVNTTHCAAKEQDVYNDEGERIGCIRFHG